MRIRMIKSCLWLVLALLTLAPSAGAQQARTFAVLPFTINGPDRYQYLSQGVQSMLNSRLTWMGHFEPAARDAVERAQTNDPATTNGAAQVLQEIGTDYVSWGTVTILGETAAIDLYMSDGGETNWSSTAEVPVDQLIPQLESMARDIRGQVFHKPGDMPQTSSQQAAAQQGPGGPQNPDFIQAGGGEQAGPEASVMNPQFRYEGGAETPGRWRSQTLRYPSVGLCVGDVDGDGKNEVVILAETSLNVLRVEDGKLVPIKSLELSSRATELRLNLLDFDRDGIEEIIVCAQRDERPHSMVLSFAGGEFKTLMDNIRLYLNVVPMPPTYTRTLIGQPRGSNTLFRSTDIAEYYPSGDDMVQGNRVRLPDFTNVFNFAFLPEGDGAYKIVQINNQGRINVFTQDLEVQSQTEETFNSTGVGIVTNERMLGMGQGTATEWEIMFHMPMRISVTDLDQDGTWEALFNKDLSIAAQIFDRYRSFSQGEIHSMYWDGVGLALAWKTRRIRGTVMDYLIADLDNDNAMELCVLVNTYSGALGWNNRKTLVVAYDLDM